MKIVKNIKALIIILSISLFTFLAYKISNEIFEPKAYDYMVNNIVANKYGSDEIAVIIIDDKSLNKIRWPWKRELYSKIFDYLNQYTTAKMIGFDAIITTPDIENPESDKKFFGSLKKIDNLVVGFAPLTTPYVDKQEGEIYNKLFKNKFDIKIEDTRSKKPPSPYESLSIFPPNYFMAIKNVGSVLTTPEIDGTIRGVDQVIDYNGTLYPSLSLRMYAYMHKDDRLIVKNSEIVSSKSGLKIPTYNKKNGINNRIHYYKLRPNSEYSHKTYSAIDIMNSLDNMKNGKPPIISPQVFEDKIVLVGANAKAIAAGLEDIKKTPISSSHPGIDVQATNLENMLHNEFLAFRTDPLEIIRDLLRMLILLSLTFLAVRYFSMFAAFGIVSLLTVSYIAICVLYYKANIAINIITPLMFQLVTLIVAFSYKFFLEGQNKAKIQHAMGRYISQDIMQSVVRDIDGIKLGGKRANVTVLFADIRGFTSMSEKMSAEEVSVILNDYFTEIEPIIGKYNGVINKFIGDAVMAIFGEPIQDKNHAENAVKCADEMLKKVESLQHKWMNEGKPKLEIGVGINTGDAFVGNIGSEKRLEYTVIGDMVNLASRIESYNKIYKTRFLISSTTYEKVRNIVDVIKISEVTIRGKAKKLDIYEVLRLVG